MSLKVKQAKHDQGQGAFFQAPNLFMVSLMFVLGKDHCAANWRILRESQSGGQQSRVQSSANEAVPMKAVHSLQSRLDFGLTKSKGFKTNAITHCYFPVIIKFPGDLMIILLKMFYLAKSKSSGPKPMLDVPRRYMLSRVVTFIQDTPYNAYRASFNFLNASSKQSCALLATRFLT